MIYFDNASTTELSDYVKKYIPKSNEVYGNSSAPHKLGLDSAALLQESRLEMAKLLGVEASSIYFTSGSTEAINLLFQGYARMLQVTNNKRNEIIITKIEHPAVYQSAKYLESLGFVIHELDNDRYGKVNLKDLKNKINNKTALVSIMSVNNETGVIQNMSKIYDIVKKDPDILLFSDTTQSIGKTDISPYIHNLDAFCVSAHKIGGPKGVGFLYLNSKFRIMPLMFGGGQEKNYRPGTTSTPAVFLMSKALQDVLQNFNHNFKVISEINTYLESELKKANIAYRRTVPQEDSSPYIFSVILPIHNNILLVSLSDKNIYVSKRSACSSMSHTKSRILESMSIEGDDIDKVVRISFSHKTKKEEIDVFIKALKEILTKN